MDTGKLERAVADHYGRADIAERISQALGLDGAPAGSVAVEALFPVDQLHHGGVGLTAAMAEAAGVGQGMTVLDAGSGIGGSARYLADRFACRIEAIDLSAEYVRAAEALDRLVGLEDKITHRVGTVTDLPWDSGVFDVVWSQNVTMNVANKRAMFAEALRVLRPGGVYVLTHLGAAGDAALDYPLPWAMTPATSFATPPAGILQSLAEAGFGDIGDHAPPSPAAPPQPATDDQPDESAAMGGEMRARRANAARAVADGRLVPMLVTARRP